MELPLPGCLFKEGLHCSRKADGHDHLIGVDVLQSLGCNVLRCAFCKNSLQENGNCPASSQIGTVISEREPALLITAHQADLVSRVHRLKLEHPNLREAAFLQGPPPPLLSLPCLPAALLLIRTPRCLY